MRRWLADRRYRRHHNAFRTSQFRLMVLTDDWWPTFSGNASWCDGRRRPCPTCGGRCCPCRHATKP